MVINECEVSGVAPSEIRETIGCGGLFLRNVDGPRVVGFNLHGLQLFAFALHASILDVATANVAQNLTPTRINEFSFQTFIQISMVGTIVRMLEEMYKVELKMD